MRLLPLILLLSIIVLTGGTVLADQVTPFAPMNNVTGNYTLSQGVDTMRVNTNMPLSSQDVVYPDVLFYIIVLIGVAFLFLAAVFVARAESVPSIAILMCGVITFGVEFAAAEMTPLVGYIQVYQQILSGTPNVIYVNQVVVYTQGIFAAYACWGLAVAGVVVAIAGTLSFLGYFQRKGLRESQRGNYLEQDIAGAQDPEVIRWREKEPRK